MSSHRNRVRECNREIRQRTRCDVDVSRSEERVLKPRVKQFVLAVLMTGTVDSETAPWVRNMIVRRFDPHLPMDEEERMPEFRPVYVAVKRILDAFDDIPQTARCFVEKVWDVASSEWINDLDCNNIPEYVYPLLGTMDTPGKMRRRAEEIVEYLLTGRRYDWMDDDDVSLLNQFMLSDFPSLRVALDVLGSPRDVVVTREEIMKMLVRRIFAISARMQTFPPVPPVQYHRDAQRGKRRGG